MNTTSSKAIITVIGADAVGIIAKVSGKCSEFGVNILDITQKVFETTFAMIMLVETDGMKIKFSEFSDEMKKTGEELGVIIRATHEELFNVMHHV
ncbi:MAG: ACT domain-containing protein [Clostridia bacterium]|nr:ACT domain-containing protein [Clostridia bacterium]